MNLSNFYNSTKPILITGETGTGKSKLAKDIHDRSASRQKPFVKVNLAALPDSLFESELYGHEKGAFTGAISKKVGFLESAGSGTIFLDEIGELTLDKQIKLLHLLDDGLYYPVGSHSKQKFKGRFIFATNRDLSTLVEQGSFRRDFYYRIRYCEIKLTPVREKSRSELTEIIQSTYNDLKVVHNFFKTILDNETIEALCTYSWPGNYREIINTLEYLIESHLENVKANDLPTWVLSETNNIGRYSEFDYYQALSNFERRFFDQVMTEFQGQVNRTANHIGLSKVTLISKLKKYGIDRREYKFRGEVVGL